MMKFKKIFSIVCCFLLLCLSLSLFSSCKSKDQPQYIAIPFVKIKNTIYTIDTKGAVASQLANNYENIGDIKDIAATIDEAENGETSCCHIGDKIYQSSDSTDEIYVYTTLFSDKEYRYLRFCQQK